MTWAPRTHRSMANSQPDSCPGPIVVASKPAGSNTGRRISLPACIIASGVINTGCLILNTLDEVPRVGNSRPERVLSVSSTS